MLEDADPPAVADQLDPSGRYRRALRAALLNVFDNSSASATRACDREPVRVPRCTMHGGGRSPEDGGQS